MSHGSILRTRAVLRDLLHPTFPSACNCQQELSRRSESPAGPASTAAQGFLSCTTLEGMGSVECVSCARSFYRPEGGLFREIPLAC